MVLSQGALAEDEQAEGDDLAAPCFKHNDKFAFVIESRKGSKPKKMKTLKGVSGGLVLPIDVRKSDRPARTVIAKVMRDNNRSVFNDFLMWSK